MKIISCVSAIALMAAAGTTLKADTNSVASGKNAKQPIPVEAPTKGARKVRDFVLTRMREMRLISREEYEGAVELNLSVRKRTNPNRVSYAIDLVRQQAIAALGFDQAMNEGVRIRTTYDARLLQAAERSLRTRLEAVEKQPGYAHLTYARYREINQKAEESAQRGEPVTMPAPTYLQGAALAVDNATGGILALAGGRDFLHSEYNRAVQGRRPPGTLFTPFVAAAAYAKGSFRGACGRCLSG